MNPEQHYLGNVGVPVFWDQRGAVLGGIGHDFYTLDGLLFVSSITLPTNGKDFTTYASLDFSASATLDTGEAINFGGARLEKVTFHYDADQKAYFVDWNGFTTTPEPTTFLLLGTGLAGIGWRKFRAVKLASSGTPQVLPESPSACSSSQ